MDIDGKRFLVAGAGVLGAEIARALAAEGADVALTSRDPARIESLASELGATAIELEITDDESRRAALDRAEEALGGLDGLVVATGAVAFGTAGKLDADVEERVVAIDAIGPMRLIAAAVDRLAPGGAVVAFSAVVAEYPTAGMAAYSAAKAALSAYVTALRRERRRELSAVIDVRPGHMETGFSDRAIEGEAPSLPEPGDRAELITAVIEAIRKDQREVAYDPLERELNSS